jgi:hypothetical protein
MAALLFSIQFQQLVVAVAVVQNMVEFLHLLTVALVVQVVDQVIRVLPLLVELAYLVKVTTVLHTILVALVVAVVVSQPQEAQLLVDLD